MTDKVSDHFRRHEFACHCGCGFAAVDSELLWVLEKTRSNFNGNPVKITSGCRCKQHNANVGGSEFSRHVMGYAVDIQVVGVNPADVADYLEATYPNTYGIGRYSGWTHIDVRDEKARWGT